MNNCCECKLQSKVYSNGILLAYIIISQGVRGGSNPGRKPNKQRDFLGRYEKLLLQYFVENPIYDGHDFRRRFRMSKRLFLRISHDVCLYDEYFVQKKMQLVRKEFRVF